MWRSRIFGWRGLIFSWQGLFQITTSPPKKQTSPHKKQTSPHKKQNSPFSYPNSPRLSPVSLAKSVSCMAKSAFGDEFATRISDFATTKDDFALHYHRIRPRFHDFWWRSRIIGGEVVKFTSDLSEFCGECCNLADKCVCWLLHTTTTLIGVSRLLYSLTLTLLSCKTLNVQS